jgi:integrase/recombinase XerC
VNQKQQIYDLVKCEDCSAYSVQYIRGFSEYLLEQKSKTTVRSYVYDLITFVKWFERVQNEDLKISSITSETLILYQGFLSQSEKLKPQSINRKFSAIRSFLQWSAQTNLLPEKRIPQSPEQIYEPQQEQPCLSWKELNQLLQVVEQNGNLRDIAIIMLLTTTGLRVSELCALTWKDIDSSEQIAWLSVRGKKANEVRKLPIAEATRKALISYHSQNIVNEQKNIFIGKKGPMTSRGVTPNILRYTFLLQLSQSALSAEEIAYFLGHTSPETIYRYYKSSNEDIQENLERVLRRFPKTDLLCYGLDKDIPFR